MHKMYNLWFKSSKWFKYFYILSINQCILEFLIDSISPIGKWNMDDRRFR